jgi:hypothetical protein
MVKSLVLAASLFISMNASANFDVVQLAKFVNKGVLSQAETAALDWKVGDSASYNIDIASFIKGKMSYTVKSIGQTEATLTQNVDIMGQKQNCETVIDTTNGKVKSIVCDGQQQNPGEQGEIEVVDMKEDKVTVPAGTFECLYIKAIEKKENKTIEQWANPKLIPVMGMIKAIMPSQMGPVNIELTSFKKM